jgi:hypothetical protein
LPDLAAPQAPADNQAGCNSARLVR